MPSWRDETPILLGAIPFGLIYGVAIKSSGVPATLGQVMSVIIFAGSAQLITARLFGESAPALTAIVVPELLVRNGQLQLTLDSERLLAGLAAIVVAWYTRNVLWTISLGMAMLWLLQWLF